MGALRGHLEPRGDDPVRDAGGHLFFGIEELAVQLEEPFSILPLSRLCDGVWDSGVELFSTPAPEEEEEEEEGKEAPAAFEAAAESLPVGGRRR